MHHLLLLAVLFGWILFLFLAWQAALPLYVIAVVITLTMYWKILQARSRRPVMGKRAMIGGQAVVVRVGGYDVEVKYEGEIWRAVSSEPLYKNQQVIIKGVEGLTLQVAPLKPGASDDPA
jgi:membrane-bound serine protease (ClpP class)